ncbi:MAG: symmetrical bis(5'-nucleosyl)-tetraphosphatase [Marinobacterium sp.]|nr:symmetrical bis(5'-nucleosyl)-tetraphosphatase [Marinobacterium sp.]
MATYAVGDIQGCYDELRQLLEIIQFNEQDTLWVAGDLVNRGPRSLETLRFLKSLGEQTVIVLGNHDLHLLAVYYGSVERKRSDTLNELLDAPDVAELMDWLRNQKLAVYDEANNWFMSHAGLPPVWSAQQAVKYASEVEMMISSHLAQGYFDNMYGNQPTLWDKHLMGWDRLRTITNYLTRMRFCDTNGQLDFKAKGGLESQPNGYLPWFRQPRKDTHVQVLFGHWAALEGRTETINVFALDTGCVWGNALTAMRLEDQQLFHCHCNGSPQPDGPHQLIAGASA